MNYLFFDIQIEKINTFVNCKLNLIYDNYPITVCISSC